MHRCVALVAALLLTVSSAPWFARGPITLEERIQAEEAIEKVLYSHRIWPQENPSPKPPFEQVVSRAQLQARCEEALEKSALLEELWRRPVTPEQLQAETERIFRDSRDRATLAEIVAALKGDPELVAECLARPLLVDRLLRSWYWADRDLHADVLRKAEAALALFKSGEVPERAEEVTLILTDDAEGGGPGRLKSPEGPVRLGRAEWDSLRHQWPAAGETSLLESQEQILVVATREVGTDRIEASVARFPKRPFDEWWAGPRGSSEGRVPGVPSPFQYELPEPPRTPAGDGCTDAWLDTALSKVPPTPRSQETAVWTGSEMIVWGGTNGYTTPMSTGGRYNPATDTWTPTSCGSNAPSARSFHSAIWTGTEMIIWGGGTSSSGVATGGRYDPVTDSWKAVGTVGAPAARTGHGAVWTGTEMIVWGGYGSSSYFNTGARYNPSADTWTPTTTGANCPVGRSSCTAVWTGSEMIVWGGNVSSGYANTGGRYNPTTDSWVSLPTVSPCPVARSLHSAVWTGSEMIVWGGYSNSGSYKNTGGRYNPTLDVWTATSTGTGVPSARQNHVAVWTGTEMIVWGGYYSGYLNTGGRYSPGTDTWTATPTGTGCPTGRQYHAAVWTGSDLILWGGYSSSGVLSTGARFAPGAGTWVPTSSGRGEPSPRYLHTAIWTGAEMVIWGGSAYSNGSNSPLDTGGRYFPVTDSWLATPASGLAARMYHTAIWTGTQVIVWGGQLTNSGITNTGSAYDPLSDTWTATPTGAGVPAARAGHTAVWTGSQMIIWGGSLSSSTTNTGGTYDPATGAWAPTTTSVRVPDARTGHSALWTGTKMIVWGGQSPSTVNLNTGGIYDPASGRWTRTSTALPVPYPMSWFTAAWTGKEMLIWGVNGSYLYSRRYDPQTDSWAATSNGDGFPPARVGHAAVWTGSEMILWGGGTSTGGIYDPESDTWCATSVGPYCPGSSVYQPTAVWTGSTMLVWGGYEGSNSIRLNSGGAYLPPLRILGSHYLCGEGTLSLATTVFSDYQWALDGTAIPGATGQVYDATAPGQYTVTVTAPSGCTSTSAPFLVTARSLPEPTVAGVSSGCEDPGVLLQTEPQSHYQWVWNGADIAGANGQTYVATRSGQYAVRSTDTFGCTATSPSRTIDLVTGPRPVITGTGSPACPLRSTILTSDPQIAYQWYYNAKPINGATGQSFEAFVTGDYSVRSPDAEGCFGTSEVHRVTLASCQEACGGWTWRRPLPDGRTFTSVVNHDGLLIAVGEGGRVAASYDGLTWSDQASPSPSTLRSVTDSPGLIVAVGDGGVILTSTNGRSWIARASGTSADLLAVHLLAGQFVAVGRAMTVLSSADGITWAAQHTKDTKDFLTGIAWKAGTYAAVGGNDSQASAGTWSGILASSSDLENWAVQNVSTNQRLGYFRDVEVVGTTFVAVGDNYLVFSSDDGSTWTSRVGCCGPGLNFVLPGDRDLLAGGSPSDTAWTGAPGRGIYAKDWTPAGGWNIAPWTDLSMRDLTTLDGAYVAVGEAAVSWKSTDLEEWSRGGASGDETTGWEGVTAGNLPLGKPAVVVGADVYYGNSDAPPQPFGSSSDGTSWTFGAPTAWGWYEEMGISFGYGEYVTTSGRASTDLLTWSSGYYGGGSTRWYAVEARGPLVVCVGNPGYLVYRNHGTTSWTMVSLSSGGGPQYGVTWNDLIKRYAAVGNGGSIYASDNGTVWTRLASPTTSTLRAVAAAETLLDGSAFWGARFVAVGDAGTILSSQDGLAWTPRSSGTTKSLRSVAWTGNQYETGGVDGTLLSSPDGFSWYPESTGHRRTIKGIASGPSAAPGAPPIVIMVGGTDHLLTKESLGAGARAIPDSGQAPLKVAFRSNLSGGQTPYQVQWDFGDGTPPSNALDPVHRYAAEGVYTATVTVSDCEGMMTMRKISVTVVSVPGVAYRVPWSVKPLRASKAADPTQVDLSWDPNNCPSDDYHLLYGFGSSLTSWEVAGGQCSLGIGGAATWHDVPDPGSDSSRFLWFLVVGDDGAHSEGSWGTTSSGEERGGTAASGLCDKTVRASGDCGTFPQFRR